MAVYKLFWDEFSSWYLEMVKPAYGQPIDRTTYDATLHYFDMLLRLLHPFMPFITEELWQHLAARADGESIMYARLPEAGDVDAACIKAMDEAKEIIAGVRTIRLQRNIPNKTALDLQVMGSFTNPFGDVICKLANVQAIDEAQAKDATAATFLVGTTEYAVPLGNSINVEEELKKLEADLKYMQGFKMSIEKKLGNEKFVNNAPEAVVAGERKKLADATAKIATLEAGIAALKQQ